MTAPTLDADDLGALGDALIAAVRVGAEVHRAVLDKATIRLMVRDERQRADLARALNLPHHRTLAQGRGDMWTDGETTVMGVMGDDAADRAVAS